jgi:hypothetical protein
MYPRTSLRIATLLGLTFLALLGCVTLATADAAEFRRLPMRVYVDKMQAGWIGQMAGVGWGGPTEFKSNGRIIPEDQMPKWRPELINQFGQDDIYVEMTFLQTLERYGFDVSIRQAGIDFANSGYALWHANKAGRDNLRAGIAPPDSGHPQFNKHADDIDYQIEADFSGLIAPALPNLVIELGEKFGRLMNYGDGLYAGQFVGGMYAEAFFEDDPVKIVEAGLRCIPKDCQYAEMVRDMLRWYQEIPDDWQKTWLLVEDKYHRDPRYTHGLCSAPGGADAFSIDAKLNGAYIIMGLLYGKRDLDQTIIISTRCGQDSDCNPSNAAGVLFTSLGRSKLPERFTVAIDSNGKFSHTEYTFPRLIEVSEALVRSAVVRSGGRIERDTDGNEVLVIPVQEPQPTKLEHSCEPGPIANSRFTNEEMEQITALSTSKSMQAQLEKVLPGWTLSHCGPDMDPGRRAEYRGRKNVFLTHPLSREIGCVLSKTVAVPAGKKTSLRIVVANDDRGDWTLVVQAGGKTLLTKPINQETTQGGWAVVEVDLSGLAGQEVKLELANQADGWSWEAGYWAEIAVESR